MKMSKRIEISQELMDKAFLDALIIDSQYKTKNFPDPYNRIRCLFYTVCPFKSKDPRKQKEIYPRYYGRERKCLFIEGYKCPFDDRFPDKRNYSKEYPYPIFNMDSLFNVAFRTQIRRMSEDMSRLPVRPGIFFPSRHAQLLYTGQKKIMVKTKRFDKFNNYPIYWFDQIYVYGLVRLGNPYGPVNREQAMRLQTLSGISPEEFSRWFGNQEQFWFWKIMVTMRFKQPIKHPPWTGIQVFKRQIALEETEFEWDISLAEEG